MFSLITFTRWNINLRSSASHNYFLWHRARGLRFEVPTTHSFIHKCFTCFFSTKLLPPLESRMIQLHSHIESNFFVRFSFHSCIIRERHKKWMHAMRMTIIAFGLAAEDWLWIIYLMYLEFYGILNQNLNFMSFVSNAVRDLLLIFDNFCSPKLVLAKWWLTLFRFLHIYFCHGNKFNYLSQLYASFPTSSSITGLEKSLSQIQWVIFRNLSRCGTRCFPQRC